MSRSMTSPSFFPPGRGSGSEVIAMLRYGLALREPHPCYNGPARRGLAVFAVFAVFAGKQQRGSLLRRTNLGVCAAILASRWQQTRRVGIWTSPPGLVKLEATH